MVRRALFPWFRGWGGFSRNDGGTSDEMPIKEKPDGVDLLLFLSGVACLSIAVYGLHLKAQCDEACAPSPSELHGGECFCNPALKRPKNSRGPEGPSGSDDGR